jgi:hypothetical protein
VVPALAAVGLLCGATAGAGVSVGLSAAEAIARTQRALAAALGAALGGAATGLVVEWVGRWALLTLVGLRLEVGGGVEGLAIGGGIGVGYALATAGIRDGHPAPTGRDRARVVVSTAAACAVAGLAVSAAGRPLVGGTIHLIAQASAGAQALLTPLGALVGETGFGPRARAVIGAGEAAMFGIGLSLGLTHRRS